MSELFWIFRILCTISVFQIFLICFYLFVKKKGSTGNKVLISLLLITWGIFITGSFILLMPSLDLLTYDTAHLMNLTIFLVAPLLYIYLYKLFRSEYRLTVKDLFHPLPFLIIFIFLLNEIIFQGKPRYVFYPTAIYLVSALFIQNAVYFFLIINEIKYIPSNNGNRSKLNLYKTLLISALTLFLLKFIIFIVWNIFNYVDICIWLTGIFFLAVFIIVNFIVIFSLNNPDLIAGVFKYQNSPLEKDELSKYLDRIKTHLTENKIYTDPLISLERLSKNLKIPERLLSQIINQESGLNFNDYINKFRINKAVELIKSCPGKKVLEIAFECGFNSKTTFNSAFKKFTGSTPTHFRKYRENGD